MTVYCRIPSPLGDLLALGGAAGVTHLYLPGGRHPTDPPAGAERDDDAFAELQGQLAEYFAGDRTSFDLPLRAAGTPFQHRVWQALTEIPHGETRSYGELAAALGSPGASRAVGLANGQNPISIVVPCHRVVGANGSLTGYAGGLEAKKWLLGHEASVSGLRTGLFA